MYIDLLRSDKSAGSVLAFGRFNCVYVCRY